MVNLFSRLSDLLAIVAEPCQKVEYLESVFARNTRDMEKDLMAVKRFAAAVIAVERSLAREVQQDCTKSGQNEALHRLEIAHRAALEDRKHVQELLGFVERTVAEVCRMQRTILFRRRAAFARVMIAPREPAGTVGGDAVLRRVRRLVDELRQFEVNNLPVRHPPTPRSS